MKSASRAEHSGKVRIRDWKGIVDPSDTFRRRTIFVLMALAAAAMTFIQFGFLGLGFGGRYNGYALGLLVPIGVVALTQGRLPGMVMGVIAGLVQFLHAVLQPLDLYERFFSNPLLLIVFYALCGLIIGFAFSISLRNRPSGIRRIIYIAITCYLVSGIGTVFYVGVIITSAILSIVVGYTSADSAVLPTEALRALSSLGSFNAQANIDFILITVVSLVTVHLNDRVNYVVEDPGRRLSLQRAFRSPLFISLMSVLVFVSGINFYVITLQAEENVETDLANEIEPIIDRLDDIRKQAETVGKVLESETLTDDGRNSLNQILGIEHILKSYDLEADGTVTLFQDTGDDLVIISSNNQDYKPGITSKQLFGIQGPQMVRDLAESGDVRQIVYDLGIIFKNGNPGMASDSEGGEPNLDVIDVSEDNVTTEIGYMCVGRYEDIYVMVAHPSSKVFTARSRTMAWVTSTAFCMMIAVFVLVRFLMDRTVVNPIQDANESLLKITSGNLDELVEERANIEFNSLSDGINDMVDSLKSLIVEAEHRMENDLRIANTIQRSALPSTFPPFPEVEAFDLYASMNAAKEVGGDFYDFFLIDDHTLGFLIADVSGKGIPGALFMMTAKTELENFMMAGMDLADAVLGANVHLCRGNDAGMFVTVWAATLNYETGELTYVNAGHNPPLMRHQGKWEWITKKGGLFLGTFETAKYREYTLVLEKGDEIMLYTDGVNEAFNVNEEEYGNDRLEAFMQDHVQEHPHELVESLRADVAAWAEGAEQSDDITMLALEFGVAPEVSGSITLAATLDNLGAATRLIDEELDRRMCPPSVRNRIDVAFEELFVNVCHYAYADAEEAGLVKVSYVYQGDPSTIIVELDDEGVPFDPVSRQDPTLPASVQEAKIGGLGIMMTKRCVDKLVYHREGDHNVVTFVKSW